MSNHAEIIQVIRDSLDGHVAGNLALDRLLADHAAENESAHHLLTLFPLFSHLLHT